MLAACASTSISNGDNPIGSQAEDNESALLGDRNVILLLDTEQSANDLIVNVSRRGYQLSDRQQLTGLGLIFLEFRRPDGVSDEIAINDMKLMEPSATVGLNTLYIQQTELPPAGSASTSYANKLMGWPDSGCKAFASIGLIDGYLAPDTDSFPSGSIVSKSFAQGDQKANEHAETVASLLIGPGRLKNAKLYSAAVFGETPNGKPASGIKEIVLALNWMKLKDIRLINISLSGPPNPIFERAVQKMTSEGAVIVAAVGNDGPLSSPRYPAAIDGVIGVTAVDFEKNIYKDAPRGAHIDYAAPGVDIFIKAGEQSGRFVSGTSLATPYVTALIASDAKLSLRSDTDSIADFLNQHTDDLGPQGKDSIFGMGLVRADNVCSE